MHARTKHSTPLPRKSNIRQDNFNKEEVPTKFLLKRFTEVAAAYNSTYNYPLAPSITNIEESTAAVETTFVKNSVNISQVIISKKKKYDFNG